MKATLPLALLAGLLLATPLHAQTTTTTTDPTTGQTTTTTTPPPAVTTTTSPDQDVSEVGNEAILTGFVGGSFAQSALQSSVDFGGAFDYLHHGAAGFEFLAGFAPRFKLDRLAGINSDVNNYMANFIAAIPVGAFHAARPFVSLGVGALTLNRSNTPSDNPVVNAAANVFAPNETHFGGNIGAGIMAFSGAVGFRGEVRYFSALGHKNQNSGGVAIPGTTRSVLDDVSFWRANVGVAFRF